MMIETFKDNFSTIEYGIIDNNGIEKLEKVRDYILKTNLYKFLICHITDQINTMIGNLFHESNEKLKEDCIELRDLLIHWYDDKYADLDKDPAKYKNELPIFRLNSSKENNLLSYIWL